MAPTATLESSASESLDQHQGEVLATFTADEVSRHNTVDDAWVSRYDCVYNVTDFVAAHPGGGDILEKYLGQDVRDVRCGGWWGYIRRGAENPPANGSYSAAIGARARDGGGRGGADDCG